MADERIVYIHEFDENGNPRDILTSTKRTIGQFIGNNSQKSGQRYALDNDGSKDVHYKGVNPLESTTVPPLTKFDGTHQGGAFSAFEEAAKQPGGQALIATQNSISNYGELPNVTLVKGKEIGADTENSVTFSELQADINTTNGKVAKAVSENLINKTGFDNTNQRGKKLLTAPIPIQTQPGKYQKVGERYEMSLKQYKNFGIQLLLQGSGELVTVEDPSNDAERAAFIAASPLAFARLGARVPYTRLIGQNVAKKADSDFPLNSNDQYYGNPGNIAGAPNNPMIVFDGFSNFAQTATCYLMFAAVFSAIVGVAATYEALHNKQRNESEVKPHTGRRNLGISRLFGQTGGDSFFGLAETDNDYTDCVRRGLRSFFGFGSDGSIANSSMFVNNPGYSGVILRMIVSDTLDIFGNSVLGSLIPGGIPANATPPTSVVEGLERGSQTIDKLRKSRLLKFMNIAANMGDTILTLEANGIDSNFDSDDVYDSALLRSTAAIVSQNGNNTAKLGNLIKRSRLSADYGKRLSWTGESTPNLLLYTSTFEKAREKFLSSVDPKTNSAYIQTMTRFGIETTDIKLDKATVEKVETELGYSYLPFYFQDVRTNEIISFHGFLTDLQDSFSTNYETTEGYGRAGAVYQYKNNNRKTAVRFWMVATNKDDFDLMWYKLNRLIAMSQPMYTAGRNVSYEDGGSPSNTTYKFTQPFSQIPGATPIIRVRVGDIITNNKSEVDVARLYGVGNPQLFSIQNSQTNTNFDSELEAVQNQADLNRGALIVGPGPIEEGKEYVSNQVLFVHRRQGTPNGVPRQELLPTRGRGATQFPSGTQITIERKLQIVQEEFFVARILSNRFLLKNDVTSVLRLSPTEIATRAAEINTNEQTTIQQLRQNNSTITSATDNDEVRWLRETPVFKSFDGAAGEGMLAVIESIDPSFDMASMVWEDEQGSVAPKAFEVSVSLLPMFDINPGLGADGKMIGAAYRVGRVNHAMKAKPYRADGISLTFQTAEGTPASSGEPTITPDSDS